MKNLILLVFVLGTIFNSYSQQENEKTNVRVFDKNLSSNGMSLIIPVFKTEDSKVTFSYGDLRNTILDFSKTKVEGLLFAEILSDLGSLNGREGNYYEVAMIIDSVSSRMFIDQNWVFYPGKMRKIENGGPFAKINIECVKENKPVKGVKLELNGIQVQTDAEGNGTFNLKGIKDKILTLTITTPQSNIHFNKRIAVPLVCARPGFMQYLGIRIDLLKLQQ